MVKKCSRVITVLLSMVLLVSCVPVTEKAAEQTSIKTTTSVPQDAQAIVDDMGIGFNMGKVFSQSIASNLDNFEKTVDAVVQEGFETIRIPVNWAEHVDEEGHITDEEYAQKVKAFVKYAMDKGVYVIINSHEDLGFDENSKWDLS